ncbi:MAG: hypothetical protein CMJ47_09700 [Planctomyces sp.]|nr:hypothetical protein [Planctomyces sp.]
MTEVDCAIVGQGLAGVSLAWHLLQRGLRICVIDPDEPITSSRIAAGLVTPITGKRAVLSWRFLEMYEAAVKFYHHVEQTTGTQFFRTLPHYRLFASEREATQFATRIEHNSESEKQTCLLPTGISRLLARADLPDILNWQGGYEMAPAGQLNSAAYLQASRQFFDQSTLVERRVAFLSIDELIPTEQGITIPKLDLAAKRVVFCRGAAERAESLFPGLPFLPAKGEILTLETDEPLNHVYHRGVWVAPGPEGTIRVGATYDSRNLNPTPTTAGREQIMERVSQFLPPSGKIVKHQAAVRPALNNQRPVLAAHPQQSRIAVFNGLGSKGALQAPRLASEVAEWVCGNASLNAFNRSQ